jgi:hypothetical protein
MLTVPLERVADDCGCDVFGAENFIAHGIDDRNLHDFVIPE